MVMASPPGDSPMRVGAGVPMAGSSSPASLRGERVALDLHRTEGLVARGRAGGRGAGVDGGIVTVAVAARPQRDDHAEADQDHHDHRDRHQGRGGTPRCGRRRRG